MKKVIWIITLFVAMGVTTYSLTYAKDAYTSVFNSQYGTSGTRNGTTMGSCITCHNQLDGRGGENSYGTDFRNNSRNLVAIEGLDSDGDGYSNIDEIMADTWPGDASSVPATTNDPPVADAGPDQTVDEDVKVTLDGSNSSDPDDGIASYLWEQTSGTSVTLSDPTAVQTTFASPVVGSGGEALTFQLTVTDNSGLQLTDTVIVNVSWISMAPTADAGPDQTVDEGATVTLDASNSSDPDDGIASYLWSQPGGPSVTLSDTSAAQPYFVAPAVDLAGTTLTFILTVKDSGGLQGSDEITVAVNDNGINGFANDVITTVTATGKNLGIEIEAEDGGNLTRLNSVDPSMITDTSGRPENLSLGLLDLEIKVTKPGATTTVTVYLPHPLPDGYGWYKYSATNGWTDYSAWATFNTARDQVTFTLTDGGVGDADGTANGVIEDPSGPGTTPSISPPDISGNVWGGSSGGGCFVATADTNRNVQHQGSIPNPFNYAEVILLLVVLMVVYVYRHTCRWGRT